MNTAMIAEIANRPADLFVTAPMLPRPQRTPNLLAEAVEFRELSRILADDPCAALRRLPEVARRLCSAGSSGVSLLRHDAAGSQVMVRWEVVSGALASYQGMDTLQEASFCGLCLDAGTTILVSRPDRTYTDLCDVRPRIDEGLIVPLYDNARPLGALWIAHHDRTSYFCSDDARIAEHLAAQAVLALALLENARKHQYALTLLESHQVAQQSIYAYELSEQRSLRERAEASERESRRELALEKTVLQEAHHRIKNTLQIAASVLSVRARKTSSEEVRLALQESHGRLQLLAKAHELLYTSADDMQSVLMPSMLNTVSDALRQSFAETSARVKLQVTTEPLTLPVQEAIAVALLVNEVVTNAYKHAFPNDSCGEITIDLCRTSENALTLRITDNGVGLRSNPAGGGIGLKLVRTLAKQLQGVLTVSTAAHAAGTAITFTMRPASNRTLKRTCSSPADSSYLVPSEPS